MKNKKIVAFALLCSSFVSGVTYSLERPVIDYAKQEKRGQERVLKSYSDFYFPLQSYSLGKYCLEKRLDKEFTFEKVVTSPCGKFFANVKSAANHQYPFNDLKLETIVNEISDEMNSSVSAVEKNSFIEKVRESYQ